MTILWHRSATTSRSHELLTGAGSNVSTDVKGNMTLIPASLRPTAANLTLTWDFDNRLSSATTGSTTISHKYDALGRRVSHTKASTTTVFVPSGQQTICDYAAGAAPASSTYRYVYASYIDEPVMRRQTSGGTQVYYHRNQQYSVNALTGSTGAILERYAYTAYGVPTIANASGTVLTSSAQNNRYAYTGREWDNDIKLYHYRARMYDASLGRFCSKDPIGHLGGKNLYSYVDCRPVDHVDPIGLLSIIPGSIDCDAFMTGIRGGELGGTTGIPRPIRDRILRGGDYVFCGDCKGVQNRSWRDSNGRCMICLSDAASVYPDQWIAILLHELTHCDQFKCPKRGVPLEPGDPIPVPNVPVGGGNCDQCVRLERDAYRNQCTFLFPGDPVRIKMCIDAGVCYSCGIACQRNPRFKRSCAGKKRPPYYPQPVVPFPLGPHTA